MTERIIDNRILVLGIDELYRDAMKSHERTELLAIAKRVAATLGVKAASAPVEGYYAEDATLTEYFQLMRALQGVSASRRQAVQALPDFARLVEVTSSPIFGKPVQSDTLLPVGRDPLSQSLFETRPHWHIERLVASAHDVAVASDDISLVGLAARTRDAILLAATRETMVLYAEAIAGARADTPRYLWRVDEALERAARRFVATFNALFNAFLPTPEAANAETYWRAASRNHLHGRCVRLGYDDTVSPVRHYHWAIHTQRTGALALQEFWDSQIWTTERYTQALWDGKRPFA